MQDLAPPCEASNICTLPFVPIRAYNGHMRARDRVISSQSTAAVPSVPRSLRKRSPLRWISRPLPLTGHLVALTLGVLLPVLILAVIVAVRYAEAERRNLEMQA